MPGGSRQNLGGSRRTDPLRTIIKLSQLIELDNKTREQRKAKTRDKTRNQMRAEMRAQT